MADTNIQLPDALKDRFKAFGKDLTTKQKDELSDLMAEMLTEGYKHGVLEADRRIREGFQVFQKNMRALLF